MDRSIDSAFNISFIVFYNRAVALKNSWYEQYFSKAETQS